MQIAGVLVACTFALLSCGLGRRMKVSEENLKNNGIKTTPSLSSRSSYNQVRRTCDPKATVFRVGDAWKVRSFKGSDTVAPLDNVINYLNIGGHQYIEIFHTDEKDSSNTCLASFGLWVSQGEIAIQSPDWGVAINTKRVARCMQNFEKKNLEAGGQTLKKCQNSNSDIIRGEWQLTGGNVMLEDALPAEFVVRGRFQYKGTLTEVQAQMLSMIQAQFIDTERSFYGQPIAKWSISGFCRPGMLSAIVAPRKYETCNCMSFTNQFRKDAAVFASELGKLAALQALSRVSTLSNVGSTLSTMLGEMEGGRKEYRCCCTILNQKTICKMTKISTSHSCANLNLLAIHFSPWNEASMPSDVANAAEIEHFGKCVLPTERVVELKSLARQ